VPDTDETTLSNELDPFGNVTRQQIDGCAGGTTFTHVRDFAYDGYGQLTEIWSARADVARPVRLDYHIGSHYNWLERLTVPIGPDPLDDLVTTFDDYDVLGNLLQFTDPAGVVRQFTYDRMGRRRSKTVKASLLGEVDLL
jgi:YD repeat-containing protein